MAALVNGKCVHSKRKHQPHEWDWKTLPVRWEPEEGVEVSKRCKKLVWHGDAPYKEPCGQVLDKDGECPTHGSNTSR
jgi:hypothetical protein